MAYIGNTQQNQNYVPAIDYFSGNGSTTAFTLSRPVASVAQVQAVIENVPQNPGDAYTVSGNTITFTSAPPSGTNNIYVYYTSPNTQVVQPGQGTVGTTQMADGVTVNFNDGSAAAPSITNTGDTNTGMFFPAADTIAFSEGGVESMRIDASGNVGIGTSSPTTKLTVGSITDTNITAQVNASGTGLARFIVNSNGVQAAEFGINTSGSTDSYGIVNNAVGLHTLNTLTPLTFGTNSTERMRINSAGEVLIGGTTSLSSVLGIYGAALGTSAGNQTMLERTQVSSSNANYLEISEIRTSAGSDWTTSGSRIQRKIDATWHGYIQFGGTGIGEGISFGTGGTTVSANSVTERMRITSNGGVSFGSSGTNFGTSGQVLTSNGDAPPSWGSASSIGVGQTWQNVAGSRALNTTYTNSTGRAIMVSVTVNSTVAAGFNMRFFVDGVVMAADGNSQTASTYSTGSTQVIVPNGSTYYVPSAALSNGAGAILYWFELR